LAKYVQPVVPAYAGTTNIIMFSRRIYNSMCLIAFAWRAHPEISLLVAANRDEWRDRPAAPATWWDDAPQLLGGRDLQAGGTWLGVTNRGRFAAITNFRDPSARKTVAPSRGQLVADFLRGEMPPKAYLAELAPRAGAYNDFNLLVGEGASLMIFSSRDAAKQEVPPGVHALSNHRLNEPWPKVNAAKSNIHGLLQAQMSENDLLAGSLAVLSNATQAPDHALPNTGVGLEWERRLSASLIVGADYGTRCSTTLLIGRGHAAFAEHTRGTDGNVVSTAAWRFALNMARGDLA
jgi:uncharacterized protein with NRDE domain